MSIPCFTEKQEKDMEVLFVVNARDNHEDYKAICDKFIDNFSTLSSEFQHNIFNPIVLSEKKTSTKKIKTAFINKEAKIKLLEKTKCSLVVFIKTTDLGRNGDSYEMSLNAAMLHSSLDSKTQKILEDNFSYVFKDLRKETLNRNNELEDLKNTSAKLFIVCQLINATAYEYSKQTKKAVELFNDILTTINKSKDIFYQNIRNILICEIYVCFEIVMHIEYEEYITNGKYDVKKMLEYANYILPFLKSLNLHCKLNFHNTIATIHIIEENYDTANNEIKILEKYSNQLEINKDWCKYDYAFLLACYDNPSKYLKIIRIYSDIKDNIYMNVKDVFCFVKQYYNTHQELLGLKIALFCIYHFNNDIKREELSSEFILDLIEDLKKCGNTQTAETLTNIYNERNY